MGYNFLRKKGIRTMDEKPIENAQNEPTRLPKQKKKVVIRKVYTPPALTVYGKLIELTAGGSQGSPENQGVPGPCNPGKPDQRC